MNSKKFLAFAMAAAMTLSMTACGGSGSGAASSGTDSAAGTAFKLGGTGPLTGGASIYGLAAQRGAQIAVDEINAQGGITDGGVIYGRTSIVQEFVTEEYYRSVWSRWNDEATLDLMVSDMERTEDGLLADVAQHG